MSKGTLINMHTHVFTDKCVPGNFLRILPNKILRRFPESMLSFLRMWGVRKTIRFLNGPGGRLLGGLAKKKGYKLLSFLDIGLLNTQQDVFNKELEAADVFDPKSRIVILTMNMDYMDVAPPEKMPFISQLAQVKDIKRYMPDRAFPFLGIDPRHLQGQQGVAWVQKEMFVGRTKGGMIYPYFSGLKLYPALGFFPFDGRLFEIFEFAEKHEIPVLTHTTRVGSLYIGPAIEELIPKDISILLSNRVVLSEAVQSSMIEIQQRIAHYRLKDGWIKNNPRGYNDFACDLFGHPQNYVVLLEQFPQLKLCLAHMGGDTEIDRTEESKDSELVQIRKIDNELWFYRIKSMMVKYPNLYTDISYTLSALGNENVRQPIMELMETLDNEGNPLGDRVLFGTDFFMTEREDKEVVLWQLAKKHLAPYWNRITVVNNERFLGVWLGQPKSS